MDHGVSKKDLGVVGTVIALIQLGVGIASSQSVNHEFSKSREDLNQLRLEREQYFVRKGDFESLSVKMDQLKDQISELNIQVSSIKTFMKTRYGYSAASYPRKKRKFYLLSWDTREWNLRKKD
jgi:predicted  nucleic acid-binding Zn-ribbon protein